MMRYCMMTYMLTCAQKRMTSSLIYSTTCNQKQQGGTICQRNEAGHSQLSIQREILQEWDIVNQL